jgi:hypothetical protein
VADDVRDHGVRRVEEQVFAEEGFEALQHHEIAYRRLEGMPRPGVIVFLRVHREQSLYS